ncbi:hypothetical protein N656DRAFT_309581 [Canariomyces notabilis]|uniref:Uncharacterized protein n=1 Tax=Canariomyces notabilis TaxID=2074819 RepID=A0AAN6QHV1_9PEZI|nr:hypothetical protein N656DRAFT_309581 [Canariomyces arenarius]
MPVILQQPSKTTTVVPPLSMNESASSAAFHAAVNPGDEEGEGKASRHRGRIVSPIRSPTFRRFKRGGRAVSTGARAASPPLYTRVLGMDTDDPAYDTILSSSDPDEEYTPATTLSSSLPGPTESGPSSDTPAMSYQPRPPQATHARRPSTPLSMTG